MKKFAALLLALVMLVTLCACGSKDNGILRQNDRPYLHILRQIR